MKKGICIATSSISLRILFMWSVKLFTGDEGRTESNDCVCITPKQRQSFKTDTILSNWRSDLTSTQSAVTIQALVPAMLEFECAANV
jgi:hypothetical protein